MQVYLDNSATTQASEAVANSVHKALTEHFGNPSSLHTMGQTAEGMVREARQRVSALLSASPAQIVFTGSGTEADNLALHAAFKNPNNAKGKKIVISAIEHPAVREAAAGLKMIGAELVIAPVTRDGTVALDFLEEMIESGVVMVSVMHVNNETGIIQPIKQIGDLVGKARAQGHEVLFHCDAIQSFGKLPVAAGKGNFEQVDLISLSAHKIHGPKGIGALWAAHPRRLAAQILGGGQEGGIRSGTENVPGVAGFGVAAGEAAGHLDQNALIAEACRQRLLEGIEGIIPDVLVNSPRRSSAGGKGGDCSPYLLNISFLGVKGEVLVHELEQYGIFVSTGAACGALKKEKSGISATLAAIGLTKHEAEGALRFSFSRYNTLAEMDYVLEHLKPCVDRFRRIGRLR